MRSPCIRPRLSARFVHSTLLRIPIHCVNHGSPLDAASRHPGSKTAFCSDEKQNVACLPAYIWQTFGRPNSTTIDFYCDTLYRISVFEFSACSGQVRVITQDILHKDELRLTHQRHGIVRSIVALFIALYLLFCPYLVYNCFSRRKQWPDFCNRTADEEAASIHIQQSIPVYSEALFWWRSFSLSLPLCAIPERL